jgi:polysaccharide chain length determinant protein (PEP-CTERM system associated)
MSDDIRMPAPEEPFVLRALEILRRRAVLAVTVFTAILVSAVAIARYLPDLYRADAMVLVERQLPESVVRPAVSGELESRLHVIKQEIVSRDRLTDLMKRFDLYPEMRARGDVDSAIEQLRHDIQVELTGPEQVSGRTKTVSFNLSFTGRKRETVAEVTNAIADFYVAQNDQMRSDEAARATRFLKEQMENTKRQLDENEKQVEAYTNRHAGELPQQVDMNLATLERLNTQLRLNGERQMRTLDQRERLFDVPVAAAPAPTAAPVPGNVRLEKLKHDLAQLDGFPDKHPDVRRIKDEIAALEAEAAEPRRPEPTAGSETAAKAEAPAPTRNRTIASLDAEMESLKTDEANLRQTIAGVERRLEGVPYRENEFATMSRDHRAMREQYESLLKRYEEAQLGQSMETENQGERFRILESAIPPTGPVAPNRVRLVILGLFLAVLVASMAVLLAEQFDTSFHSVDDLRQFTRVPVLVTIPRIKDSRPRRFLRTAAVTASMVAGFILIGTLSAYLARDNESLVRLLVRG